MQQVLSNCLMMRMPARHQHFYRLRFMPTCYKMQAYTVYLPLNVTMAMKVSRTEKIINLAGETGIIRSRDLDAYGIPREYLRRLCDKGVLERQSRGIHTLRDAEMTEHHSLVQASKRVWITTVKRYGSKSMPCPPTFEHPMPG